MFDIAIFAALGWERRAVTAGLEAVRVRVRARVWSGRAGALSCVVVQTGVGPGRAAAAAAAVDADAFLACGCAGALAPDLGGGDVVLADAVIALDASGRVERRVAGATPPSLARAAAGEGIRLRTGPIASSPTVLATAAAKRVAAESGALAVDMESAAVAAEAERRGLPFAALRVVLDVADQALPLADALVDGASGEVRLGRAVVALAPRPWLWPPMARLARHTRLADRRLRAIVAAALRDGAFIPRSTERPAPRAAVR
jgi:nucleoside phosphorylase